MKLAPALIAVVAALSLAVPNALAARRPTHHEKRAIIAATLRVVAHPKRTSMRKIRVSTVDDSWALAHFAQRLPNGAVDRERAVYRHRAGYRWKLVDGGPAPYNFCGDPGINMPRSVRLDLGLKAC